MNDFRKHTGNRHACGSENTASIRLAADVYSGIRLPLATQDLAAEGVRMYAHEFHPFLSLPSR